MKLSNVIVVSLAAAIAAIGATGCAGSAAPSTDGTSSSEALSSAAAWQELGERTVNGTYDQDVIAVGQDDSRFDSIQIHVEGSSLVMFEIKVIFGNGETFEPGVRLVFDPNTTSRVIDLPGNTRFIRQVQFKFGNLPGGGNARVQLFGRSSAPPPAWEELGERRVNGTVDHDSLDVGTEEGTFSAIQVRVEQSDLVMYGLRLTFGDGQVYEPNVRLVFDANTRSRVIDLPGARRFIKRVDFAYGNLPAGGDASVQLWAAQ